MLAQLQREGFSTSRKRVVRLMKQEEIRGLTPKRWKSTTDSDHELAVSPNRLERDFSADAPNRAWGADITYIRTWEGWLYLMAIIDLYSRRVVGWATSDSLKTDLALRALRRALASRRPPRGLIHHSDRGGQYSARAYRDVLDAHGVVQSMSRAANCLDNAVAESFFGTFKHELERRVFPSRAEAHQATARYIDGFYNPVRRHSSAGYMAPITFERLAMDAQAA